MPEVRGKRTELDMPTRADGVAPKCQADLGPCGHGTSGYAPSCLSSGQISLRYVNEKIPVSCPSEKSMRSA